MYQNMQLAMHGVCGAEGWKGLGEGCRPSGLFQRGLAAEGKEESQEVVISSLKTMYCIFPVWVEGAGAFEEDTLT